MSIDVTGIRAERVDWRFKSLPAATFGQTIGEVADAGLDLFADGFVGPMVVLDADAIEHNLTTMADWAIRHGMSLAPHGKTTMAPQLFARQLDLGAWGMTAANVGQLRVCRAFDVPRLQLANELVDPAGLRWVSAELDRHESFEFCCWVDSVEGVALMTSALRAAQRPLDVLIDLGAPGARSGVRDFAAAHEVAAAVAASPVLRLVGVAGYEGVLTHDTTPDALGMVAGYLERMRSLVGELDWPVDEILVSAGGSAYFDVVADVLGRDWDGLPVRPLLRAGAYVSHDDGFYRDVSPLGSHQRTDGPALRSAFLAWGQVMSRPQSDLALVTMGKRDVSFDEGLPRPHLRHRDGVTQPLSDCSVSKVSDQHTFLRPKDVKVPAIGDWVGFLLSHPCTIFDKWKLIPVVRDDTVVDLIRTFF